MTIPVRVSPTAVPQSYALITWVRAVLQIRQGLLVPLAVANGRGPRENAKTCPPV